MKILTSLVPVFLVPPRRACNVSSDNCFRGSGCVLGSRLISGPENVSGSGDVGGSGDFGGSGDVGGSGEVGRSGKGNIPVVSISCCRSPHSIERLRLGL